VAGSSTTLAVSTARAGKLERSMVGLGMVLVAQELRFAKFTVRVVAMSMPLALLASAVDADARFAALAVAR
jgi:hypothetical protein